MAASRVEGMEAVVRLTLDSISFLAYSTRSYFPVSLIEEAKSAQFDKVCTIEYTDLEELTEPSTDGV